MLYRIYCQHSCMALTSAIALIMILFHVHSVHVAQFELSFYSGCAVRYCCFFYGCYCHVLKIGQYCQAQLLICVVIVAPPYVIFVIIIFSPSYTSIAACPQSEGQIKHNQSPIASQIPPFINQQVIIQSLIISQHSYHPPISNNRKHIADCQSPFNNYQSLSSS